MALEHELYPSTVGIQLRSVMVSKLLKREVQRTQSLSLKFKMFSLVLLSGKSLECNFFSISYLQYIIQCYSCRRLHNLLTLITLRSVKGTREVTCA